MSVLFFFFVCLSLASGSKRTNSNTQYVTSQEFMSKFTDLEANNTKLQKKYNDLSLKFETLENKYLAIVNKTNNLEENNKTIFHDVHKLQGQVKTVAAKTFILDSNSRVRNLDISVLYNKSAELQKTMNGFKHEMESHFRQINNDCNETLKHFQKQLDDFSKSQSPTFNSFKQTLATIQREQNESTAALMQEIKNYVTRDNTTYHDLLTRASAASEKVGLTVCVSVDGIRNQGSVIKFDEVRSHIGNINLSALRSTGMFTCEKEGLYQISVVMNTPTSNARYSVLSNGNTIATLLVSDDSHADSGTAVVAAYLQVGDRVWVKAETSIHVYFHWSCMTIVRL